MPKRGFWNDRNYYQAQDVRYVKSSGRMYRLVYGQDGMVVQGYDIGERIMNTASSLVPYERLEGTSLLSSFLERWHGLLRICWRK